MTYPLQLAVIFTVFSQFNEAEAVFCFTSQGILSGFVLLKTPYTFPCDASRCESAEWRSLSLPTKATIATYQNQIWRIEEGFQEEFTRKENHLLLKSAKFTDQGQYEFVCNGNEKLLKLDVLYPIDVYVKEKDNITLNCYAESAKDVTWLHNKEIVLHYNGSIYPGKGYEGRVSVKKNCFKTGDISLTMTGVLETDAGIYRCFVENETIKGYPHTYNLSHVNENRSSPGDQTDSNVNEAIHLGLTIVFGIISFIYSSHTLIFFVIPKLKCQSTPATATDGVTKSDENDCMLSSDTTSPKNDSQSNVRHPVQESDPRENKPSSTKVIFNLEEPGL